MNEKSLVALHDLSIFIEQMNATNSGKDKEVVLKKYKDNNSIAHLLRLTYNPYLQFNITSSNVKKFINSQKVVEIKKLDDIYDLLHDLNKRIITGHTALATIANFLNGEDEKVQDTFLRVLDKDLSIRTGATTINKVFPDLIPVYDVALGYAEKDVSTKNQPDFEKNEWFWSRKLDGLRCTIRKQSGQVTKAFSRSGKEFKTIQKLLDAVDSLSITNVVFDGELCIIDENGDEDFVAITKEYNKGGANTTHQIEDPKLMWFDMLTIEEFDSGTSTRNLRERQEEMLDLWGQTILSDNEQIESLIYLMQTPITSEAHLQELKEEAAENLKQEGGIIRKNTIYKGKRSFDIIKVKVMTEEEFVVVSVGTGPFRVIEKNSEGVTQEVTIETVTQVYIEFKGNLVKVGSGFSLEQRKQFYDDPSLIIGKEITVSYFGESVDGKTGKPSLRFPIFKRLWENGTREDTE